MSRPGTQTGVANAAVPPARTATSALPRGRAEESRRGGRRLSSAAVPAGGFAGPVAGGFPGARATFGTSGATGSVFAAVRAPGVREEAAFFLDAGGARTCPAGTAVSDKGAAGSWILTRAGRRGQGGGPLCIFLIVAVTGGERGPLRRPGLQPVSQRGPRSDTRALRR